MLERVPAGLADALGVVVVDFGFALFRLTTVWPVIMKPSQLSPAYPVLTLNPKSRRCTASSLPSGVELLIADVKSKRVPRSAGSVDGFGVVRSV